MPRPLFERGKGQERVEQVRGGEAGQVGPPRSYAGVGLEAVRHAGRPWGERPVAVRVGGETRVVYYALGGVVRNAIAQSSGPVDKPREPTLDAWL